MIRSLVLVLTLCLLGLCAACSQDDSAVEEAIGARVAQGESADVRLADVTSLDWDGVYIFVPYTPPEQIITEGGARAISPNDPIRSDEAIALLVFTSARRPVLLARPS